MKCRLTPFLLIAFSNLSYAQNPKTVKQFRNDVLIESIHFDSSGRKVLVETYDKKIANRTNGLTCYQYDSTGALLREFSAVSSIKGIDIVTNVQDHDTIFSVSTTYLPYGSSIKTLRDCYESNNFEELLEEADGQYKKIRSSVVLDSSGQFIIEERQHVEGFISSRTYNQYNADGILTSKRTDRFSGDLSYVYEINSLGKVSRMLQVFKGDTTIREEYKYDNFGRLIFEKESFAEKEYRYNSCSSNDQSVVVQIISYWNEDEREITSTENYEYNEFCLKEKWAYDNFRFKSVIIDRYEYTYYD